MDKPYIDILFMGKGGSSKGTVIQNIGTSDAAETSETASQHDCFSIFGNLILTAEIPDIISAETILSCEDDGSMNAGLQLADGFYNDYILGEMSEVE